MGHRRAMSLLDFPGKRSLRPDRGGFKLDFDGKCFLSDSMKEYRSSGRARQIPGANADAIRAFVSRRFSKTRKRSP